LWLLAGLLLGGVVHLSTVLALPKTAAHDAYARLVPLTPVNKVVPLPMTQPTVMPFTDPAFATSVCRYDLSLGSLKLSAPISQAYTAVAFYTRFDIAYYAINDRAAGRKLIELDLMTTRQREQLPEDEDVTAADRLIVESPTTTGLIVLKALSTEPGLRAMAENTLAAAKCTAQQSPPPSR
jgi:uncharacterized membrane protein